MRSSRGRLETLHTGSFPNSPIGLAVTRYPESTGFWSQNAAVARWSAAFSRNDDKTTFLALSIDDLLASIGLAEDERFAWYSEQTKMLATAILVMHSGFTRTIYEEP
jgi:hypothetical protein